ncbi:hypothetical protein WCLP8_410008 [uncultured Gammaproteobacteria bacterium]
MGKLFSFLSAEEAAMEPVVPDRQLPASRTRPAVVAAGASQERESQTAAVSGQGCTVDGRLQMMNLSLIAERFGPRWPQLAKKAHSLIEGILTHRLSPGDHYIRQDDDSYYFQFSGLSETEARIKCALLTREITIKLMGEEAGMAGLGLQFALTRGDGPEPSAQLSPGPIERLPDPKQAGDAQANRDSSIPGNRDAIPKTQIKDLLSILENTERDLKRWQMEPLAEGRGAIVMRLEGVAQLLRQAEHAFAELAAANPMLAEAAADLPTAPMTGEPDWQPFHVQSGPSVGPPAWTEAASGRPTESLRPNAPDAAGTPARLAPEWQVFQVLPKLIGRTLVKIEMELRRQAELSGLAPASAVERAGFVVEPVYPEPPPFDWSQAEVIFSYLPMWQVSKKAINSYLCQLALKVGQEIHPIEAMFDGEVDETTIVALDRLVLRKTLQDIHILLKGDRRNIIVVPVHFTTLALSRGRRDYLGICAQIRPEHQSYLVWELIYPHIGIANTPLHQAIAVLKPHARAILLRVDIGYPQFDDLAAAGVYAVGADLPHQSRREGETIRKMEAFKIRAERGGLKAYLHDVGSLSLATAAVCAGFDHIDGAIIAAPIDNPEGIRSYKIESLYAHVFGAAGI